MQSTQRPRAFILRVHRVGSEISAQALIQRRPCIIDQSCSEGDDLECCRCIAPQIAVHLAWLREAEGPGRLHALATVDARERSTRAGEAHAVVGFHPASELRGIPDPEVRDAGKDGSRRGRGQHALIVLLAEPRACAFLADARVPKITGAVNVTLVRMKQEQKSTALVTGANKGNRT